MFGGSRESGLDQISKDVGKILSKLEETNSAVKKIEALEKGHRDVKSLLEEIRIEVHQAFNFRTQGLSDDGVGRSSGLQDFPADSTGFTRQISQEEQEAERCAARAYERTSSPSPPLGSSRRTWTAFDEVENSHSRASGGEESPREAFSSDSEAEPSLSQSHQIKAQKKFLLHESWDKSKIPVRKFFQLGFDVFSSSAHMDHSPPFGSTMLQAMSNPMKPSHMAKEFRRIFGFLPSSKYVKTYKYAFLSPTSNITFMWTMLEIFILISDFIVVPMMFFDSREAYMHGDSGWPAVAWWQRRASVTFWSLDFPLCFFKGYTDRKGDRETRLKKFAMNYIKGNCILDMVLLTIDWMMLFLDDMSLGGSGSTHTGDGMGETMDRAMRAGNLVFVLRFARALRLGKLRRLSRRFFARVKHAEMLAVWSMGGHLFALLLMCHFFACFWFGVGGGRTDLFLIQGPRWTDVFELKDSTVIAEDDHPFVVNHAYKYMESLRWTLSVMGFGESIARPNNWQEALYANFFSLVAMLATTHFIGNMVTQLLRLQESKREIRQNKADMREYMRQHRVSFHLQDRIWYAVKSVRSDSHLMAEDKVALIKELPSSLEIELRAEIFVPVLTKHPFFGIYGVSGADPHAMFNLIKRRAMETRLLEATQELFSEHEKADNMFFVVQGSMQYRFKHQLTTITKDGHSPSSKDAARTSAPSEALMSPRTTSFTPGNPSEPSSWLSEAALWLHWQHVGTARANTPCDLVELNGDKFRSIMQADLPQAQKYARAFQQFAIKEGKRFNDILPQLTPVYMMAQDVFAPARNFDLNSSMPITKRGLDEWRPVVLEDWHANWTSPWSDSHSLSSSAVISTMMTEMKRDTIMMYQTLFSQNLNLHPVFPWPSEAEKDLYDKRVLFLKRLLVLLATCMVSCTDEDNSSELQQWPYPLASVLCHGGRSMLRLHGVKPKEVLNFLLYGDTDSWDWERNGAPPPLYTRIAASHSVKVDVCAQLQEVRLKGVAGARGQGHNIGMDLPLGGLGNPTPKHAQGSLMVGPSGVPWKPSAIGLGGSDGAVMLKEFQHGHMYIRWDDFGNRQMKQLVLPDRVGGDKEDPQATLETKHIMELRKLCNLDESTPISNTFQTIDKVEELHRRLVNTGIEVPAEDKHRLENLFDLSMQRRELSLETDIGMRIKQCRGVLVHLAIELEGADGQDMVLVHVGAATSESGFGANNRSMSPDVITQSESGMSARISASHGLRRETLNGMRGSRLLTAASGMRSGNSVGTRGSATEQEAARLANGPSVNAINGRTTSLRDVNPNVVPDQCVVTVICRQDGLWLPALMQYLKRSFHLDSAAVEKIYQGISEEAWLGAGQASPTFCHHHQYASGAFLDVEYDALFLKSRIHVRDSAVLEKLMWDKGHVKVTEEQVLASGFPDQLDTPTGMITIRREWMWMPKNEIDERGVNGLHVPEGSNQLMLRQREEPLGSLLLGIENSAPLKEDLFGGTHNASAKSKDTSAFGRRKWRDFRKNGKLSGAHPSPACLKVPAELGGIQAHMDRRRFDEVVDRCRSLDLAAPSAPAISDKDPKDHEKELFRRLLSANVKDADRLLENYQLHGPASLKPRRGRESRLLGIGSQPAYGSESPTGPSTSRSIAGRLFNKANSYNFNP